MKGKMRWAVLTVALLAIPAMADYTSIQHNLIGDGSPDTSYANGVLSISAAIPGVDNTLALNDTAISGGTISNTSVSLVTYYSGMDPNIHGGAAIFTGGSFSLKFDYNGSTGQAYEISGPISGMAVWLGAASDSYSVLNGQALFDAGNPVLPGSGVWPDGGGLSSINSLTLTFGQNLSGFTWDVPLNASDTQYTITPDDTAIPEPASALFLALGLVAVIRRR